MVETSDRGMPRELWVVKPVFMGFKAPVSPDRIAAFINKELDPNDMISLMQDIIEADLLPAMCMQHDAYFEAYARHYVEQGLCHVTGRALH